MNELPQVISTPVERSILAQFGLTPERVKAWTDTVPKHPPAKYAKPRLKRPTEIEPRKRKNGAFTPIKCDPKPTTWEGYCEAARKAVKLFQAGETRARACVRCGLTESITGGITHIIKKTPLFYAVKAGKQFSSEDPRHVIAFIRWHEGIKGPSHDLQTDDGEQLREALKKGAYALADLEVQTGIHRTTVQAFRSGGAKGMKPETRAKLWDYLRSIGQA